MREHIQGSRDNFLNNSVVVSRDAAQDDALSWAARGLYLYMLSLPPSWQFYEKHLIERSPDGRDHLRRIVRELERAGLLTRTPVRGPDGRLQGSRWHVRELPQPGKPSTDSPATAQPATVEPSTENPSAYKSHKEETLEALELAEVQEKTRPKTQEPPSKAPQGAALPSVAHRGGPDADGWMTGRPTATRPLQQPQQGPSTASSGSPYPQAPQDGLPGPQNGQFQPEPPPEQLKPRAKAPAKPRDPYASRVLPESAVPDDLLGVQQLLREWWGLKPRGRTEAAFNRACSLLRRYSRSEQEQILEKAVIGGHQGLYEPAPTSARGLRSGGRSSAPSMEERCKAVSELLHNGIFPFQRNQSQLTEQ